jgi:hypothetical protein
MQTPSIVMIVLFILPVMTGWNGNKINDSALNAMPAKAAWHPG